LKSNKYPTDIELKDALKNIKYQNLDIFDTFESYIRYCVRGKMSSSIRKEYENYIRKQFPDQVEVKLSSQTKKSTKDSLKNKDIADITSKALKRSIQDSESSDFRFAILVIGNWIEEKHLQGTRRISQPRTQISNANEAPLWV